MHIKSNRRAALPVDRAMLRIGYYALPRGTLYMLLGRGGYVLGSALCFLKMEKKEMVSSVFF